MGGQKIQNVKIISNGVLKDAKWWEDSKSGLKIQIKWHLTPLLAKKYVGPKGGSNIGPKGGSNVIWFEFWGQIWNLLII